MLNKNIIIFQSIVFGCIQSALANAPPPNQSVGAASSDVYSIKSIYTRMIDFLVMFVDILAAVGIFLGLLYCAWGLVNIRNIESGKKQGDSVAQWWGVFISFFLINVVFWGLFGADLVKNFTTK